jgi:hypothetical protein
MTDWEQTEYGWDWRIVPPERCAPIDWTNAWAENDVMVSLRSQESGEVEEFIIGAESGSGPFIEIWADHPVSEEMLSEDVRAALVNAVSLTTMPVVRWRDSDE